MRLSRLDTTSIRSTSPIRSPTATRTRHSNHLLDRRTRALLSPSTCPEPQPVKALQVLLAAIHAVVRPQRAVFNDMVDHGKSLHNMDRDRRLIAPHPAYDEPRERGSMLDGSKQGGHWQDAASDWMTLHWPRIGSGRSAALEMHSSATINNADFKFSAEVEHRWR